MNDEAAERRSLWELFDSVRHDPPITRQEFAAAVAELQSVERLMTVSRIRFQLEAGGYYMADADSAYESFVAILDAERQRVTNGSPDAASSGPE